MRKFEVKAIVTTTVTLAMVYAPSQEAAIESARATFKHWSLDGVAEKLAKFNDGEFEHVFAEEITK